MGGNTTLTVPVPRLFQDALFPYFYFLIVLAVLFGGATRQGAWSDAVVELASLPLLAGMLYRLLREGGGSSAIWPLALLGAVVALPLLQLIPIPPAIWAVFPGRAPIAAAFDAADIGKPWLPISLNPAATWRSWVSMLPAVAIFLATLALDNAARRMLVFPILLAALVSVPIDALQMMGGFDSPLRFYTVTNVDRAVGFFANANHNAAFLYCVIPFVAAWAANMAPAQDQRRLPKLVIAALVLAAIMLGLALTYSRAGLLLGFVAGLCSIALIWRVSGWRARRVLVYLGIGGNVLALLIAFQFSFLAMSARMEGGNIVQDLRWTIYRITARAVVENMPFGTGFGTFEPVYQMFSPRLLERSVYVNHAHNDWLELWLDGGVPALAVGVGFIIWWLSASARAWRAPGSRFIDLNLARAGSVVILLLMLHSIVDYPMRTISMMTLFALACAFLIPPRPAQAT